MNVQRSVAVIRRVTRCQLNSASPGASRNCCLALVPSGSQCFAGQLKRLRKSNFRCLLMKRIQSVPLQDPGRDYSGGHAKSGLTPGWLGHSGASRKGSVGRYGGLYKVY
ncbi:hypothetical protein EJ04DRAFT_55993 [Polyplosphaeria fusca]|uniref:Uncharacterized protein n=1 Tax=Polyplosphaeria fusca TaxID=682080 RepID=A0A9P4UX71_9PLEO|nr:hypothetical protein EJ04DRAFT_55993 [Polyplosphaeria fusca]